MKLLLLVAVLVPCLVFSQTRKQKKAIEAQKKADQVVIGNFKNHVQYLVNQAASPAATQQNAISSYIEQQFKLAGLQPKGSNGYIQPFKIDEGKQIDASTSLKVNGSTLVLNTEYIPFAYSASKKVEGMPAMALREKGVPWFADIKDWMEHNNAISFHSLVQAEAAKAVAKGATALFLYNSGNATDSFSFDKKDKTFALTIPVVYIMPDGYKKYFQDHEQILDIELNVAIEEKERPGKNVVGFIDNGATSSVVIAASYDVAAVGNGDEKALNSTYPTINNAVKTAMLIELAKMITMSSAKSNNYLFVALSGEEVEAQGSKFWLANVAQNASPNYLINLDNVDVTNNYKLMFAGTATSPKWKEIMKGLAMNAIQPDFDNGTPAAPTYHTFYENNIPALNVYTSSVDKVNKPTSADQIDFEKELKITRYLAQLIEATDKQGKLAFSKVAGAEVFAQTPVTQSDTVAGTNSQQAKEGLRVQEARTTFVSLGVIPDKNQAKEGLKINGVSPKKLGAKLGLQPGDVLLYLGSYKIEDMNSYLQALSNFKAGDKTVLGIKRGKDDKEFAVEF